MNNDNWFAIGKGADLTYSGKRIVIIAFELNYQVLLIGFK